MATRDESNEIVKTLKQQRGILKGQITRSFHVLTNKSPTQNCAPGRLIVLEETWKKFTQVHEDILKILDKEDEVEAEEDYRYDVEELYIQTRALLYPYISMPQTNEVSKTAACISKETNIPNINFTPLTENETIKNYLTRLNTYIQLKGISENKTKSHLFLSTLLPEIHQIICDVIAPEKPDEKSFEELSNILQECLEPTPSTLANQHRFVSRIQDQNEGISVYARELKRLTVDCDFKCYNCEKSINDMFLKMQFIRGLIDNEIRVKLLQDKDSKKPFKEIVETAISIEQSKQESFEFTENSYHSNEKQSLHVNSLKKEAENTTRSNTVYEDKKKPSTFQDMKGR